MRAFTSKIPLLVTHDEHRRVHVTEILDPAVVKGRQ